MGLTKEQLKAIFKAGSKPTEAQFASMIDAALNINDTGTVELSADTLNISGSTIAKTDIDLLREGKSISGQASVSAPGDQTYTQFIRPEAIISSTDDTTYRKSTIPGRVGQFVSGNLFMDYNLSGSNNYIALGKANTADTQFRFSGNITASGHISASGHVYGDRIYTTGGVVGPKILAKKSLTTDNETLTFADSGKLCIFSSADGAIVVLPDSGDGTLIGVYYDFYVADQLTSGQYDIRCTDTTNEAIIGFLHFCDIDTNPAVSEFTWRALATDSYDQIQMNGNTTGTVGTFFRITNVAADKWMINGSLMATGTPATPFVAN